MCPGAASLLLIPNPEKQKVRYGIQKKNIEGYRGTEKGQRYRGIGFLDFWRLSVPSVPRFLFPDLE
jgi:hypothetical protein